MYQVDDFILYGTMGVCKIVEISPKESPGTLETQLYYTLRPFNQECKIFTPVQNNKTFMRPIINEETANRLIDTIPTIEAQMFHSSVSSQLAEHYEASFRTHSCSDLIELTISIHAKKQIAEEQKHKFGSLDGKYMKRAEELLYSEFSAALGIEKEKVPEYISARLEHLKVNEI